MLISKIFFLFNEDQNTKQKKRLPSDHSSQSFQEYFDNIDKEVESIKVNLKYDEIIQERF